MDRRAEQWRNSGMVVGEISGLSIAEKSKFVTRDNVWGLEIWEEWKKSGIKGSDLYYIYKVKQLLPERVEKEVIEIQKEGVEYVYEEYIEQIGAIKEYLFKQARRGTLNYATWLDDLYEEKGWAIKIESKYGNRYEYRGEKISWEVVITPELKQFVNSYRVEGTKKAFLLEYYCQGFPERVTESMLNPRINITDVENGEVRVTIRVSDYEYSQQYESREEFLNWLKDGGFTQKYYAEKEKFLEVVDITEDGVSTEVGEGKKLCSIERYRLTPNNVKVYKVTDNKGYEVEMSQGAIRDAVLGGYIQVKGLDVLSNGELIWVKEPQIIK